MSKVSKVLAIVVAGGVPTLALQMDTLADQEDLRLRLGLPPLADEEEPPPPRAVPMPHVVQQQPVSDESEFRRAVTNGDVESVDVEQGEKSPLSFFSHKKGFCVCSMRGYK